MVLLSIQRFVLKITYGHPSGELYRPARTQSHNHTSILYIDFLKFLENRDKEFKIGHTHFSFARAGNYIKSNHEIEAAIFGLS